MGKKIRRKNEWNRNKGAEGRVVATMFPKVMGTKSEQRVHVLWHRRKKKKSK